ncbi:uncharacterized protein LOC142342549 [Convolutriloba macropyga]|uniref:uncharacterized protein LOC142342549 n=1 Tax=Convolutriloba macropyga TaxID=536237 RepID=UPI003F520AA5
MATNNTENNQSNGELYESRIYTFGRVRSHTFMNDKSLLSEELEEQCSHGTRRYVSMEENWLRKSHSNNDVIQLSLISDDPYEVLNFDPHGHANSFYGQRLDKQLKCPQKSTEAVTCQTCYNGPTHLKRGGCVSMTSNLSGAADGLRYSRSSISSIPSHYVNKIFSITCIIGICFLSTDRN